MNGRKFLFIFLLIGAILMGWLTGWGFRKQIDVQDTNVDSNLTDFPTYVKINADADFHESLATGYDIRFTQSDGDTLLKYEREYWTGGNGSAATAHFWVKVPSILASGGATIYIYYGKAGAADGEDAANVWDANFKVVWHMKDATTSTCSDSTSNGKTLTKKGANEPIQTTNGPVYYAQDFDGTDDYALTTDASLRITGDITISAWTNLDIWKNVCIFQNNNDYSYNSYQSYGNNPNNYIYVRRYQQSVGDNYGWQDGTTNLGTSAWHHGVLVINRTTDSGYVYSDGSQVDSQALTDGATSVYETDEGFYVGAMRDDGGGSSTPNAGYLNGKIAELRISNTVRSAAWIKFTYYNINEGDQELTWGNEAVEGYALVCAGGSLVLSGQTLSLLKTHILTMDAGSYSLTGQTLNTLLGRKVVLDAGSYVLTGSDVTFQVAGGLVVMMGRDGYFLGLHI